MEGKIMAANVETMFSVRETPWHGLGTIIQDAPDSREAIKLAGLDWKVVQSDIVCKDTGLIIHGMKMNLRDSDKRMLGIVTDRYKIVQNEDAFAFTDALLGEGVRYETAGSLISGRRVWMLARMEGRMITDEKVDPYLVFTNSHDGTGAVRVAITPVRVVCQNTLNLALREADRQWSCAHLGNIQDKLEEAKMTLMNAESYMGALEEKFGELKLQKLDVDKVHDLVNELLPIGEHDSDKRKKNVQELREDLMCRYLFAPDLQPIEQSAYRFINAVSDFATHRNPARITKYWQENRFMSTIDGNAMIDLACKMCAAAA
jgi:phage/plasmid-like protein (TIGR03299 family)